VSHARITPSQKRILDPRAHPRDCTEADLSGRPCREEGRDSDRQKKEKNP